MQAELILRIQYFLNTGQNSLHVNHQRLASVSQSPSPVNGPPSINNSGAGNNGHHDPHQDQGQINLQLQSLNDYNNDSSHQLHKRFRVSPPSETEANANWS